MMETIGTFVWEWAFVVGLILAFGCCGIGFLHPFAANWRFIYWGAPLTGVLLVPFGANAFYALLVIGYSRSALIAAACCLALTVLRLVSFPPTFDRRVLLFGCVGVLAISALAVLALDTATIRMHGPAILYLDGSDHAGYAHLADWLNAHDIGHPPTASPDRPYDSWPDLMFTTDPRFGVLGLLAVIAGLHQTSGVFAYDAACAVVSAAALLGVAAMFSRSIGMALALLLGLFVSHWFDYAHSGYLGKSIGYPSTLFICGLTLRSLRLPTVEQTFFLMILSAAVGTMHSGAATTFLSFPILGVALLATMLWRDDRSQLPSSVFLCGVVLAAPLVASGVLSRPSVTGYPDYGLTWSYIVPRILDLENQGVSVSGLTGDWLQANAALAAVAWTGLLALAILSRNACATAFIGGPAILLIAIMAAGAKAVAFQMIGYFYPAVLCGAFALAADTRFARSIVLALAMLTMAQRLPRFAGMLDRFALHPVPQNLFSAAEIDRLAEEIGSEPVQIDIVIPQPAILLLVELGRRHLDLQWTPRGWDMVLGYRSWPSPAQSKTPTMTLRVVDGGLFHHFELERLPNSK
jgi:hypothetical protein